MAAIYPASLLMSGVCRQTDVISLFPMEVFYYFTGVNSLLRFPRLLKVGIAHPSVCLSIRLFPVHSGASIDHRIDDD